MNQPGTALPDREAEVSSNHFCVLTVDREAPEVVCGRGDRSKGEGVAPSGVAHPTVTPPVRVLVVLPSIEFLDF
jgi:hypothetical protein